VPKSLHLPTVLAVAVCLAAMATAPAHTQQIEDPPKISIPPAAHLQPLHVLWDQALQSNPSPAMDVRWASDRTVYVAWLNHGVSELALDGNFTALRNLFPDAAGKWKSRYLPFENLAVSKDYVVASSRFNTLGFRPSQGRKGRVVITKVAVGIVEDLDLSGNRLLLLGNPEMKTTPTGGVAWLGPLTAHPATDLTPILIDAGGAHTPSLVNCSDLALGGVRFLPGGTFIVVPGFQPGAHLFDPSGRLLHTWDTKALGLDADAGCAAITTEQLNRFGTSAAARFAYINQHRVVDAVLPLAQGPGLLIRSVVDAEVRWQLVVLQSGATIAYDVPFTGTLPYDRLRGDVHGNRIALLLGAHDFDAHKPYRRTHLYVAELPQVGERPVEPLAGQERGQP
jgi:hypothetical protein